MISKLLSQLNKIGEITLNVHVKTNKKTSNIEQVIENTLYINLQNSAIEGKANKELIKLISKKFGVPQTNITFVRGISSKRKVLRIVE